MTIPLIILAVPSALLGFFLWYQSNFSKFVQWGTHATGESSSEILIVGVSLGVFLLGVGGAFWIYFTKPPKYEALAARFSLLHRIISRRYLFDEFYLWIISAIFYPVAEGFAKFDYDFLDQSVVDGIGRWGRRLSSVSNLFDGTIIDQILVDGQSTILNRIGGWLRRLQSGLAQSYLFWMVVGLGSMLIWIAHTYK